MADIREELARALHEGRDHTRDGVSLGNTPICNCYLLADKALASPVIAQIQFEAWREGWDRAQYAVGDPGEDVNPYPAPSPSNERQENA